MLSNQRNGSRACGGAAWLHPHQRLVTARCIWADKARTYIITKRRITSGELSNQRDGSSGLRRRGLPLPYPTLTPCDTFELTEPQSAFGTFEPAELETKSEA